MNGPIFVGLTFYFLGGDNKSFGLSFVWGGSFQMAERAQLKVKQRVEDPRIKGTPPNATPFEGVPLD